MLRVNRLFSLMLQNAVLQSSTHHVYITSLMGVNQRTPDNTPSSQIHFFYGRTIQSIVKAIAATASAPLDACPDQKEFAIWVHSLPEKDKNNLLVAVVSEPSERWKNGLLRRFKQKTARRTLSAPDTICRRCAGDLLRLVHARVEERARLLEAKRRAEAARRKAEDEANRSRYLDQLGKREEATWNQIAAHIQKRQPNEYDKAVSLLIDMRDLALRQGRGLHSSPYWGNFVRSTPPRKVFCAA